MKPVQKRQAGGEIDSPDDIFEPLLSAMTKAFSIT